MSRLVAVALTLVMAGTLASGCTEVPSSKLSEAQQKVRVAPMDRSGSNAKIDALTDHAPSIDIPDRLPVYRVVRPSLTKEGVKTKAARLGVDGSVVETVDDYAIKADGASFVMDKNTGSFDYTTSEFEELHEPLRTILSDDEYRLRAEQFLQSKGLMEPDAEFRDVNRDNVVGKVVDGKVAESPYMIEVRFSHKPLNGVSFDKGVGPKIIVQFGEDGRIVGAMSVWRRVERAESYPAITRAGAVNAIESGDAIVFDAAEPRAEVTDFELTYYNDPLGYAQQYVIPYYLVKGKTTSGQPFSAFTRAISRDYLIEDRRVSQGIWVD